MKLNENGKILVGVLALVGATWGWSYAGVEYFEHETYDMVAFLSWAVTVISIVWLTMVWIDSEEQE